MQHETIVGAVTSRRRSVHADLIWACAFGLFLSLCWAISDWHNLRYLILPDADDMMRLAQVRDWLAGQGINDWTQYRMAPPAGAPMHWSRVNDIGIAAIILAATPLFGRHGAELAAVLIYPATLFTAHLFLSARIARRLWTPDAALIAIVLGALAYPGTTVFIPGRIDHHALQVVLIEIAILAMMTRAKWASGAVAGIVVALSLIIGLEAAPQIAAMIAVMVVVWVVHGDGERGQLAGFAAGLAGVTCLFLAFLKPSYWSPELCDAFTPASSHGTLAGCAALGTLALVSPKLRDWRSRLTLAVVLGAATGLGTLLVYPACVTGPYGAVDPFLRQFFITHIDEANSILAQHDLARAISLAGLMVVAVAASVWMLRRQPQRWPTTTSIAAIIMTSALLMLSQVRGVYIGAPVSAAVLAGVVVRIRRLRDPRPLLLVGAWLACTGLTYLDLPLVIARLAPASAPGAGHSPPDGECNADDTWQRVDRYPAGAVMASTNLAAYLIGATRMSSIGAGYHRNNVGNMAMYRYFLSDPATSARIARQWHVRYVAFCPGDFSEIDVTHHWPHSLATMLATNRPPPGLRPLPMPRGGLRFYRVTD